MRERIEHISVYEVFLCMFVILIHVLSEGVSGFTRGTLPSALFFCTSRLVSFAVPAFIFTSGMKLCMKFRNSKLNYPVFLWGRIKKIYLPYLLWAVIYYLFCVYRLHYFDFNLTDLMKYLLNGEISAQFYFVLVIMQFYLLMPLCLPLCRKCNPVLLLPLGGIVTIAAKILLTGWVYNDRIFVCYLVFWLVGCAAGLKGAQSLHAWLKRYQLLIYLGWLIFSSLHVGLQHLNYCEKIAYPYPEPLMVLFSLCSILGFYLLIEKLTHRLSPWLKKFFQQVSGASYYIFLVHCLVLLAVNQVLDHFAIASLSVRFLLRTPTVYLLSILLCVAYTNGKRFIFGKRS